MKTSNTPAQTEQPTPNLNDLTLAFAKTCFDYGAIMEAGTLDKGITNRLNWLISDTEKLSIAASNLHNETKSGSAPGNNFNLNPARKMSLVEITEKTNLERGFTPMPLEVDLLIKRVKQGGHSGQFLADAFISAYRTNQPFQHSLGELLKLDAEGFRLFHQILHIKHISGWRDDDLYQIESQILELGGVQ